MGQSDPMTINNALMGQSDPMTEVLQDTNTSALGPRCLVYSFWYRSVVGPKCSVPNC